MSNVDQSVMREFVSSVRELAAPKKEATRYHVGTVTHTDIDGTVWVSVPGGSSTMPVTRASSGFKTGDAVCFTVENGVASMYGNVTDPAVIGTLTAEWGLDAEKVHDMSETDLRRTVGYFQDLYAENVTAENLVATNGYIQDLTSKNITTENIRAVNGYIQDLQSENVTAQNIVADHATIGTLDSNYAHITNGVIDNAKIGYADVDDLNAHYAEIQNGHINSALIDTAAIVDEQVFTVTGNKATLSEINADKITVRNLNAKNLTIDTADGYVTIGNKKTPTKEFIDSLKDELQQEIDGAVETWTSTAVPLLNNYPASQWADDNTRAKHVGDICYVQQSGSDYDGFCYRFAYSGGEFSWVLIKDSSVTKALADISDLQTFESETVSWIDETEEGLTTIRQNHTALSGKVDKTVKETVQLWFTKANTTAPAKPTAEVTSTSTAGNAWRAVVPAWNASYPNYFYCYQWKFVDGTFGWSTPVLDKAMTESQGTARDAKATADAALPASTFETFEQTTFKTVTDTVDEQSTAIAQMSETVRYGGKNLLPHTGVTVVDKEWLKDNVYSAWNNIAIETVDGESAYKYDQTWGPASWHSGAWCVLEANTYYTYSVDLHYTKDVSFDMSSLGHFQVYNAASEKTDKAHEDVADKRVFAPATIPANTWTRASVTFLTNGLDGSTFQIYPRFNIAANDGTLHFKNAKLELGTIATPWDYASEDVTTLTNTVNSVKQTATENSASISSLTTTVANNKTSIEARASSIEQSLNGFKTTVSKTIVESARNLLDNCVNPTIAEGSWGNAAQSAHPGEWFVYTAANGTIEKTDDGVKFTSTHASNKNGIVVPFIFKNPIKAGDTVTLSFAYRGTMTSWGHPFVLNSPTPNTSQPITIALNGDGEWHDYTVTWNVTRATTDAVAFLVGYEAQNGKWVEIRDGSLVLERGDIPSRVSQAETAIEQTSEAIGLSASGTTTIANPNLSPYFEYLPLVNKSAGSPYWYYLNGFTAMEDGWAKGVMDNSSGSSTTYINMREQAIDALKPSTVYTAMLEVRNYSGSGTTSWVVPHRTTSGQVSSFAADKRVAINKDGVYRLEITTLSDLSNVNEGCSAYIQINAGAKISLECRMSLYEGVYRGPWKPYSGSQLYASQAELKVANNNISSKVSTTDYTGAKVASLINQSAAEVKIQAQHVEIDGTTTFGSSTVSDYLDSTYDAKGAASTAETNAKTYADGIVDGLEIGGTNLLTGSGDYAGWWHSTGATISDDTATLAGTSTGWNATVSSALFSPDLLDGSTFTLSLDWKSTADCVLWVNMTGSSYTPDTTPNPGTRTKYVMWALPTIPSTGGEWQRVSIDPKAFSVESLTSGSGDVNGIFVQIYARTDTTVYVRHMKLEKSSKPTAWSPAPEDTVSKTQRVYYRKAASGAPAAPTSWVTAGNDGSNLYAQWTTKLPPIAASQAATETKYLYLYTCVQSQNAAGQLTNSAVLLDDSTTVIDGGKLITGSVTANAVETGSLTIGKLDSDAQAQLTGSGFTILWDSNQGTTYAGGEAKLCLRDPLTGTVTANSAGWVVFNGVKRTVPNADFNPNAALPYNIPIYLVLRLSSATSATGTMYAVFYQSGWKSASAMSSPSTTYSDWTWAEATDLILGKCVEPSSEAVFTECEVYDPPLTAKAVSSGTITAASANSAAVAADTKAGNAAKTATNYITHVDDNGITIHPSSTTDNRAAINANGMQVYKGGNLKAEYADTVKLYGGNGTSAGYAQVSANGFTVVDRNAKESFRALTTTDTVTISVDGGQGLGYDTNTYIGNKTGTTVTTKTLVFGNEYGLASNVVLEFWGFTGGTPNEDTSYVNLTLVKGTSTSGNLTEYSEGSSTGKVFGTYTWDGTGTFTMTRTHSSLTTKGNYLGLVTAKFSYTATKTYVDLGVQQFGTPGAFAISAGTGLKRDGNFGLYTGRYNTGGTYAFQIGDGTADYDRHNLMTVNWTGQMTMRGMIGSNIGFSAVKEVDETDGYGVLFGIGSGGNNHGIYSDALGKWLIHADAGSGTIHIGGKEVGSLAYKSSASAGRETKTYTSSSVSVSGSSMGTISLTLATPSGKTLGGILQIATNHMSLLQLTGFELVSETSLKVYVYNRSTSAQSTTVTVKVNYIGVAVS